MRIRVNNARNMRVPDHVLVGYRREYRPRFNAATNILPIIPKVVIKENGRGFFKQFNTLGNDQPINLDEGKLLVGLQRSDDGRVRRKAFKPETIAGDLPKSSSVIRDLYGIAIEPTRQEGQFDIEKRTFAMNQGTSTLSSGFALFASLPNQLSSLLPGFTHLDNLLLDGAKSENSGKGAEEANDDQSPSAIVRVKQVPILVMGFGGLLIFFGGVVILKYGYGRLLIVGFGTGLIAIGWICLVLPTRW